MQKSTYCLAPLRETLQAANRRYLEFLSALETPEVGEQRLAQITETKTEHPDHIWSVEEWFSAALLDRSPAHVLVQSAAQLVQH